MTKEQKTVAIGAASGVVAMIAAVSGLCAVWPHDLAFSDTGGRLAYALRANALAVVPLLVAIIVVSNDRFMSEAIDPTLGKENTATQINGRVVENTLQQFVLFATATMALSVSLSSTQMRLIPAAAIVFVVARAAFWIGYRIHPLYRAFGMAATSYLNIGLLGFAVWMATTA